MLYLNIVNKKNNVLKCFLPSCIQDVMALSPSEADPQEDVKNRIRDFLKQEKLSVAWLAEKLELAQGSVRNWFYSKAKITPSNLDKIEKIIEKYSDPFVGFKEEVGDFVLILPPDKETLDLWNFSLTIYGSDFYEIVINILNDQAQKDLKEYLNKKEEATFKSIGLADILLESDVEKEEEKAIALEIAKDDVYLWRKAAFVKNMTLNRWANIVLDDYSNDIMAKKLGVDKNRIASSPLDFGNMDDEIPF